MAHLAMRTRGLSAWWQMESSSVGPGPLIWAAARQKASLLDAMADICSEGCMYPVQNPREGSLSLAWDSSGSLLAVCTAMGRLSSWLPPVAPTPSVPQARTASRSGASDGSSRQPPGSSASGVRPQTDAPVSTFNTHPQLCHEAPSPGSTHPSLHSDSPDDNQQHCHGKSALPLQDIQLTYGSRKRQRTAGHCSGSGAKQKQTADYAWLQGADETPSAAPHHQGSQAYKSSTLWCNLEAEQMTAAEASSSRAENPDNTDATLIWQHSLPREARARVPSIERWLGPIALAP
ncbi:MAG: hypothetical protein FRX49_09353 [Trebouxia sp. A1-2]|nr:MAG: hypothetical protein FRX49_09353 [Trebouxia sp. A1-2]